MPDNSKTSGFQNRRSESRFHMGEYLVSFVADNGENRAFILCARSEEDAERKLRGIKQTGYIVGVVE